MEDSWRYRTIQGNICPTCSISHFPFCPPPPAFNPSIHRPYFDPLSNNPPIPRSISPFNDRSTSIRPITPLPIDVYTNPINRIPRDSYLPTSRFDYLDNNDFNNREFLDNDRSVKRMRVGEIGSGYFSRFPPPSGTSFPTEDERRLSLIRQHGAPSGVLPPQIGVDSEFGSQRGSQLNGYSYESDWQGRNSRNPSNNLYDPRDGYVDRVGQETHQEPVLDTQNRNVYDRVFDNPNRLIGDNLYNKRKGFEIEREYTLGQEDHGFGYSQPKMQGNVGNVDGLQYDGNHSFASRHEPWHQPNYVRNEESVPSYIRSSEPTNVFRDVPDYVNSSSRNGSYQFEAKGFDQVSEFSRSYAINSPRSSGSGMQMYENKQKFNGYELENDARRPYEIKHPPVHAVQESVRPYNSSMSSEQFGAPPGPVGIYPPPALPPRASSVYPPLPPMPPPSLPMEPPGPPPGHFQARASPPGHFQARASPPTIPFTSSSATTLESRPVPLKIPSPERPKVVDASSLFTRPNRDTRPDHIVVILRGLPGSGKSYLAKMLRDLEVENGANAPRIHSMDDYFMTEVEKVEESESKSSGLVKGKKRVTKKVMEYCYEPEMEEAYRSSMLKAFKKTLEDGVFTFIIVDDRNLRIADFAQFWACAKRSGYEVYLLEAMYKDPVGCAARNIHGFTSDDIKKMAELWEEAPSLYLRLDIQSLFHGDDLKEQGIQEVDMDMDDVPCDESLSGMQNGDSGTTMEQPQQDSSSDEEERGEPEENNPGIKQLGRSKWLYDADEDDIERSDDAKKASNALSGLIQAYAKGDKSVHWGDEVGKSGFSISANKRQKVLSLVIGPGAGYNLKSNPLPEEENESSNDISWQSKKRCAFEEQLRAERASERESFKAVVDRRRRRIGGLEMEDELQLAEH